jgi:hypothetical protein
MARAAVDPGGESRYLRIKAACATAMSGDVAQVTLGVS